MITIISVATALVLTLALGVFIWSYRRHVDDKGMMQDHAIWEPTDLPFTLHISSTLDLVLGGTLRSVVNQSAEWWNKKLGFKAFCHLGEISSGVDVPIMSYPSPFGASLSTKIASTKLTHVKGKAKNAVIYADPEKWLAASSLVRKRAMMHELGHLFWLDHDDVRSSVMYSKAAPSSFSLSNKDRDLIVKHYKP